MSEKNFRTFIFFLIIGLALGTAINLVRTISRNGDTQNELIEPCDLKKRYYMTYTVNGKDTSILLPSGAKRSE